MTNLTALARRHRLTPAPDGRSIPMPYGRIVSCPDGDLAYTGTGVPDDLAREICRLGYVLYRNGGVLTVLLAERRLYDLAELLAPEPDESDVPYRRQWRRGA